MNAGLSVFDASVQDLWLKAIEGELGDCQRQEAYATLRACFMPCATACRRKRP